MKQGLKKYMEIQLAGMDDYWDSLAQIEIVMCQYKRSRSRRRCMRRANPPT